MDDLAWLIEHGFEVFVTKRSLPWNGHLIRVVRHGTPSVGIERAISPEMAERLPWADILSYEFRIIRTKAAKEFVEQPA